MSPSLDLDVVILGAGPGGAAAALALRQRGVERICLVERTTTRHERARLGESLSPTGLRDLGVLGVPHAASDWQRAGHRPHHATYSAWGRDECECDDFLRRGQGHAWHVDRTRFDEHLRSAALEQGVELLDSAELLSLGHRHGGIWELFLDRHGETVRLSCAAIVDATGRNAMAARRLGAERVWTDKLVAVRCEVEGAWPAGTSFVATTALGYWYAAAGAGDRVVLLLFTDGDLLRRSGARDPSCLLRHWRTCPALRERLPPPQRLRSEPTVVPAPSAFSRRAGGPGWVAVGDALMSFDPLSASGIGGALSDAIAASGVIEAWVRRADSSDGEQCWRQAGLQYAARARRSWEAFRGQQADLYLRESRFSTEPFWLRRRRPPAAPLTE